MRFIIKGSPVVLKNSKRITRSGGIIPSAKVEAYRPQALLQLLKQCCPRHTIMQPVHVKMLFYGAWKRSNENLPDLSNLYQMPEDLLEQAGVIENDNQIESHDGSRRICLCDTCTDKPDYKGGPNKGQPKPDCGAVKRCPKEFIEIEITEFRK